MGNSTTGSARDAAETSSAESHFAQSPSAERRRGARAGHRTGAVFTGAALAGLLIEAVHSLIPDWGGMMLILESLLPWWAAAVTLLALAGVLLRFRLLNILVLAGTGLALLLVAPPPVQSTPAAGADLQIASQNVGASNPRVGELAAGLAATGADIVTLQELTPQGRAEANTALAASHPYTAVDGSIGLWSRYPIESSQALDLGLGWRRALQADVVTPAGNWRVYSVHVTSVRPGARQERDAMLDQLTQALENDPSGNVVAIGDFNAGGADRAYTVPDAGLEEIRPAWTGAPFTWPAGIPLVQLDHALLRSTESEGTLQTLDAHGSDHRGLLLSITDEP